MLQSQFLEIQEGLHLPLRKKNFSIKHYPWRKGQTQSPDDVNLGLCPAPIHSVQGFFLESLLGPFHPTRTKSVVSSVWPEAVLRRQGYEPSWVYLLSIIDGLLTHHYRTKVHGLFTCWAQSGSRNSINSTHVPRVFLQHTVCLISWCLEVLCKNA